MESYNQFNAEAFLSAYDTVYNCGDIVRPRGQLCRELTDYTLKFDLNYAPLSNFEARKFNLKYAKQELLWYIRGDRYDAEIEKHATMWAKLRQIDNGFNSNYGQYIFRNRVHPYNGESIGSQFDFVVSELIRDPDTRRASIVLLKDTHLYSENSDIVCTYALNFRIRQNRLHMTVMMRSSDLIFGITNDAFCFWGIAQLVYGCVRLMVPDLELGQYTHFTNSLHIYERHFGMVQEILIAGLNGYKPIEVPTLSPVEADLIVATKGRTVDGPFMDWLMS